MSNLSRTQLNELADIYSSMSSTGSPEQLDEISDRVKLAVGASRLPVVGPLIRGAINQAPKVLPKALEIAKTGSRILKTKVGADPNRSAVVQAGETLGRNLVKAGGEVTNILTKGGKEYGRGLLDPIKGFVGTKAPEGRSGARRLGVLTTQLGVPAGLWSAGTYAWRELTGANKQQLGDHYDPFEDPNATEEQIVEALETGLCYLLMTSLVENGYADDLKSASVILENMSDDWCDYIAESFVGE